MHVFKGNGARVAQIFASAFVCCVATAQPTGATSKPANMPDETVRRIETRVAGSDAYRPLGGNPPTCSAADVQQALSAAPDGATVTIPAGTCDWGSQTVSRAAGISVRGAGRDLTKIRRTGAPAGDGGYALIFDCTNGKPVELSGIAFEGMDTDSVEDNGVKLGHSCRDFKVHDTRFTLFSNAGLEVRGGNSRGVVYSSEFIDNFRPGLGYGVVVYGDDEWPGTIALGTAEAVFIEDNFFSGNRHDVTSNYGSRDVIRHNTLVTNELSGDTGMIDAHGRQEPLRRGSRSWEIYENVLQVQDTTYTDGISIRGGDGVIFNNTIDGEVAYDAQIVIEQGCPATGGGPGPAGPYPAPDQTMGAWIWNNVRGGSSAQFIRISDGNSFDCTYYLQEGRNYFQYAKAGYVPYVYPHPLRSDSIFHNGFE